MTSYIKSGMIILQKFFGGVLMNQTTRVIRVLDDSSNRSIEYQNRFWLRHNVDTLHIHVRVENCVANTFDIAEEWAKEAQFLFRKAREFSSKLISILEKRLYCSLIAKMTDIWYFCIPQRNEKRRWQCHLHDFMNL